MVGVKMRIVSVLVFFPIVNTFTHSQYYEYNNREAKLTCAMLAPRDNTIVGHDAIESRGHYMALECHPGPSAAIHDPFIPF